MERRRFVVSLLSVALAAGAGCLGSEGGEAARLYAGSLPPSAASGFDHHDVARVREHEALDALDYAAPRAVFETPGVAEDDVETAVSFGDRRATVVAKGGFDASAVAESAPDAGYTETDADGWLFEKDGTAFGVDGSVCVVSSLGAVAVREALDALDGRATTADSDADFTALVDELADGTFVTGSVVDGARTGEVGRGKKVDVRPGEETAEVTLVRLYATSSVASNATQTANETARRALGATSAEADGRVVRVTGTVPVDRL